MKKHIIITLLLLLGAFTNGFSQQKKDIQTATIAVTGNCGMCKTRIENAAYITGVKRADWNKQTQQLEVVFRPSKTSKEAIQKAIAEAGHDTESVKADSKSYAKLPACCSYRESNHTH